MQIYHAKMIHDSRTHAADTANNEDNAAAAAAVHLPAPLLAASKAAWAASLFGTTATPFHQDVSASLALVGVPNTIRPSGAGVPVIDICVDLPQKPVVLMLTGPEMYSSNAPHVPLRSAGLSRSLLEGQGYAVLGCSMLEWQMFGSNALERGTALCAHLSSFLDSMIGSILQHAGDGAGLTGLATGAVGGAASGAANGAIVLPDSVCEGNDSADAGFWYCQAPAHAGASASASAAGSMATASLFGFGYPSPSSLTSASSPSSASCDEEEVLLSASELAQLEKTVQFAMG